ncbi:MAG: hypothetical protein ACLUMN_01430 [Oscillospiraceae bacterium]
MNIALFASGSSGNCALVSDGDTHILLDAGISARRIRAGLSAQDVTADALAGVLVTQSTPTMSWGLRCCCGTTLCRCMRCLPCALRCVRSCRSNACMRSRRMRRFASAMCV